MKEKMMEIAKLKMEKDALRMELAFVRGYIKEDLGPLDRKGQLFLLDKVNKVMKETE